MALGKVAREADVYPFKLCRAIIQGCVRQLRADGKLQPGQHGMQCIRWKATEEVVSMCVLTSCITTKTTTMTLKATKHA